jgi:hypothetical protein
MYFEGTAIGTTKEVVQRLTRKKLMYA